MSTLPSFDFSNIGSLASGSGKQDQKPNEKKKDDVPISLTFDQGKSNDTKKSGGLDFMSGKDSNPFANIGSTSKGSAFSFGGSATGIDAYLPKGSAMEKFFASKLAEGEAKSASKGTKPSNTRKFRSDMTKAHEIKEIEIDGVSFERIFSMPESTTGNVGEQFRRRINIDGQ